MFGQESLMKLRLNQSYFEKAQSWDSLYWVRCFWSTLLIRLEIRGCLSCGICFSIWVIVDRLDFIFCFAMDIFLLITSILFLVTCLLCYLINYYHFFITFLFIALNYTQLYFIIIIILSFSFLYLFIDRYYNID